MNIGIVTALMENYYFGSIIKGIYTVLEQYNARIYIFDTFMLYEHGFNNTNAHLYDALAFNHIDGWIILPQGANHEHIRKIYASGKPLVLINQELEIENCTFIKDDGYKGMGYAVEHLINHGHRDIAFVGWFGASDMRERYKGYENALKKHGIPLRSEFVYKTNGASTESGRDIAREILSNGFLFSALVASNDLLALSVMFTFERAGLNIPEDVAIIGYDNIEHAKPNLTSMSQDICGLGVTAANVLLKRINEEKIHTSETVLIQSKLIERFSCGCKTDPCVSNNITVDSEAYIYLANSVNQSHRLGAKLMQASSNEEIKSLLLDIPNNCRLKFMSYWDNKKGESTSLIVGPVLDFKGSQLSWDQVHCKIEDFPPKEILFETIVLLKDDIIFIHPVRYASKDLGVLVYISSFNQYCDLFDIEFTSSYFAYLKFALERINLTTEVQEMTVQSEKMTAITRLTAGFAHELNTPMGVSVTASSYLKEQLEGLLELFKKGQLGRSRMESVINSSIEASAIILNNLTRAAELIGSFKQISADQSSEQKRTFNIKFYIEQNLLTLSPILKKSKHKVRVICDEKIEIRSYPGVISQIITNLLMNSLIHAFSPEDEGCIIIEVKRINNGIVLTYSDNGKGIDKEFIDKIYEPFFTTRRDDGGTGLGLNIIYNIITNTLQGTIKCMSEIGKGTTFIIEFPAID